MKQPKFKFGDKCQPTDNDPPFIVDQITYVVTNQDGTGEYKYNARFWESETILYQEPQKKKLYAYRKLIEIAFFETETIPESYSWWKRAPEYDIEYSEKK